MERHLLDSLPHDFISLKVRFRALPFRYWYLEGTITAIIFAVKGIFIKIRDHNG